MRDLGLLTLRLTAGGLLAGHGAQKLFGAFGGYGLQGTAGWLESLGLKPGHRWAALAGGSEFAGGALTALGFLHPIGPITMLAPMSMAVGTAHWGKPIWVTSGGGELPVTNLAIATALFMTDPGVLSVDHAFGIRLPRPLVALALAATVAGTAYGLMKREQRPPREEVHAGAELAGEEKSAQSEAAGQEQFGMSEKVEEKETADSRAAAEMGQKA